MLMNDAISTGYIPCGKKLPTPAMQAKRLEI